MLKFISCASLLLTGSIFLSRHLEENRFGLARISDSLAGRRTMVNRYGNDRWGVSSVVDVEDFQSDQTEKIAQFFQVEEIGSEGTQEKIFGIQDIYDFLW